ncbi:hypothetical protein AMS68_001145 [Peltaster fructicola]|uniref:Dolichyl-diphosphooligosaccharide--protein glycosyltransferase subunit WBP1 n=1 Tax=Peltaster fructicola TaxID=286661 RepID=A0A6H0XLY1_9PEZI|nr:hypothetical protein AMS68_001145 [Peltaster fructicola]
MRSLLLSLCLGFFTLVSALSAQGNKLLVVIDDEADRSKYSRFWTSLEGRGYDITYKTPKDSSLSLFHLGEPAYSHLLLLPTKSKALGIALSPNSIVDFVNAGSNVLLGLSGGENTVPAAIASLLLEFDVQLAPERNSVVVDHFNYDLKSSEETHDVILANVHQLKRQDVKNFFSLDGLIAFPRAVGQVLGNASPLLSSVVKGDSTAYIYSKDSDADDEAFATGSQISLVTAFQGRNSARFTILGSSETLEDKWFGATVQLPAQEAVKTSNEAFAAAVSAWTFKELGVLKVNAINHFLNEGVQRGQDTENSALELNPDLYRVKNDVSYSISVSSWTLDHWEPFVVPSGDELQLEVSMLSPFHRLDLKPAKSTANETIYQREFKLPDQHGIFNLFVEYRRPFFTNLEEKRTVTVRHFAHDEWPRSYVITGAYPWIGGIWVTIAGFIGFVAIWLYSAPAQPKQDLKAKR